MLFIISITMLIVPDENLILTSSGDTLYVGGGGFGNFSVIQDAINAAKDGDTVFVYSGTYYENVIVDKIINLIGEDRDTTIINASGIGDAVYVTADWVNITGFTAIGSDDEWDDGGIKLDMVRNCRVFENNASDSSNGIILLYSDYNILTDNIGTQNRVPLNGNGLLILFSSNNIVINNTFSYWDVGIGLGLSHENNIKCNNCSYNRIGIVIGGSASNNNYNNNNIIVNNAIFMNVGVGILMNWCGYGNNTIIGNTISSNRQGIYFFNSSYDTIIGNTISSNFYGIFVRYNSNYNTFIGNSISSNNCGINISWSSNNTFIGNTISSSIYYGINIEHDGYNTIYHNVFTDNNGSGVQGVDDVGNNSLNDSYPSGGNYWSDWTTPDMASGPNQDQPGPDGIVDFPYLLDGGSGAKDYYPLTTPPPDVEIPDLEVKNSDIVFDPSSPVGNGTIVTISATIHNMGLDEVKDIIVRFYNGDPNMPGSYQIGSDKYIPSIDGGSNANVDVQWTASPDGIHNIYVVVDPDNTIIEMKECNNVAFKALEVIEPDNIPLTLYIKAVGDDIILNWTQSGTQGLAYYLIYRATSQTGFDFSSFWVNTFLHDDRGTIPLRTTWNDTYAALGNTSQEYYYTIRPVHENGDIGPTSRTVGKWTATFLPGVSTLALPLEPLQSIWTDNFTTDIKADYIKYMDPVTHMWRQHDLGDGNNNNTKMRLGEGYEIKFSNMANYTFCGLPVAMIIFKDDKSFFGFDPMFEAQNLEVTISPDGDVNLTWQEPPTMASGDYYEIYYSNTRDGFFGDINFNYSRVEPPVDFGNNTTTHVGAGANNPGSRLYYMVVPFNIFGIQGASTYSVGIWTEEYSEGYDTMGIPLKLDVNHTADWYCDNIPDCVGINYFNNSKQRWRWHSTVMPEGAFDTFLEMTEGYQISTSGTTKFTFIGV
ncbi:MAG: right-handed parallel beta-helix repeat-containing protein [Thermoplasmata archaeon]|nr:MAG: right-handed parallel beta-helix repeat-containing protein [Thermoplasmata archaeon]